MIFVHYPTGGFGHYINKVLTVCVDGVDKPHWIARELDQPVKENSHNFQLLAKKFINKSDNIFEEFKHFPIQSWDPTSSRKDNLVILIDCGYKYSDSLFVKTAYPEAKIIKMYVDDQSISILAERILKWMVPEEKHNDYRNLYGFYSEWILNNSFTDFDFEPQDFCINIPISSLFFNVEQFVSIIDTQVGTLDRELFDKIHYQFEIANNYLLRIPNLEKQLFRCIESNSVFDFSGCSNAEYGFLLVRLEQMLKRSIPNLPVQRFESTVELNDHLKKYKINLDTK